MAVSYSQSLQNSRMDAVIAAIDSGAPVATLEICTAAYAAVLVAIPLNADPSFTRSGTKPNTLITMNGVPKSANASGTGTAAVARIKEGGGTTVADGLTVGTSATDIILNSTSITTGQQVSITAGTITHSA
jgi:hypothetical protein